MNWDLTSFFPEFDGTEMKKFKIALEKDINSFLKKARSLKPLSGKNEPDWEKVFLKSENIVSRLGHVSSYVGCLCAADSRNEDYLREDANLALLWASVSKIFIEMLRGIKGCPNDVFSSFIKRKSFDGIQYFLKRLSIQSRYTMSPDKEILATDLGVDGIGAWGRLYDTLSGRLEFDMEFPDGTRKRLPMSQRTTLLEDKDRRVRRAAFIGGNAAWQSLEHIAAAALNAISGTRHSLNRHRRIPHFLDVALFQSGISRKTLDAMLEAVYDNLDIPRSFLKMKAKIFGLPALAWYDTSAPLDIPEMERFPWEKGKAIVRDSFVRSYPKLGEFLEKYVYDKKWVDWEPRNGKRPGGFCTSSTHIKQSRIFMTYQGSLGDVNTLAHEVGHAFHSYIMKDIRPFAHDYPMTLAETASTFAEGILSNGLLDDASISDAVKCYILDQDLNHAVAFLLNITMRYEFEKSFYEARAKGELGVSDLKELMIKTQRRIYGKTLAKGEEDPYYWASKLHFYITEVTFYNFPYTFGYLLSKGIFALFQSEGKSFLPKYEKFLEMTGSDTCENVARKSIGRNLSSPDFWDEAIKSVREPMKKYSRLLPLVFPKKKN
ncbi:M3 family oligoendopeptidase [Candidatus Sumerlaeota bacterium]|nr:M3 family oligoendopeptidase [Candidatus Sumerlaeota bacterium]